MSGKNQLFTTLILTIVNLWLMEKPVVKYIEIPFLLTESGVQAEPCPIEQGTNYKVLNIGSVQGNGLISPCNGSRVSIQGIVTGIREDQNLSGARFYTFFIQDPPGQEDGDPETSDGIAVFSGPTSPQVEIGDFVHIDGTVQEYYGLTEIDFQNIVIEVLDSSMPLPDAVNLIPPAENLLSLEYNEKLEGMLVRLERGLVIGPTHQGCGFAAIKPNWPENRIIARSESSLVGQIVNILNYSDAVCSEFPQVSVGDRVEGIYGPLTYEFGQFKVVQQKDFSITIQPNSIETTPLPNPPEGYFSAATYNLNDFFSPAADENEILENESEKWDIKIDKIAATINDVLHCPTIIGLQEVENRNVLEELVQRLDESCGFTYEPTIIEGPDARGIDNAALTNPRLVTIEASLLHQRCDRTLTAVEDPGISCPPGQYPLFSRPPLELLLRVGEDEYSIFVNHFKSKRGGEKETAPIRMAQAQHLRSMIEEAATNESIREVIVLGDFNDYEDSIAGQELTRGDFLINILKDLPPDSRYSYNFGGVSQLVDWILVSRDLAEKVSFVSIAHVNADYPIGWRNELDGNKSLLRSSDHDIPFTIFQIGENTEDGLNSEILEPTATVEVVEYTAPPIATASVEVAEYTAPPIVTSAIEQASPDSFPEAGDEEPGDAVRTIDPKIIVPLSIFLALLILLLLGVKRAVNQR